MSTTERERTRAAERSNAEEAAPPADRAGKEEKVDKEEKVKTRVGGKIKRCPDADAASEGAGGAVGAAGSGVGRAFKSRRTALLAAGAGAGAPLDAAELLAENEELKRRLAAADAAARAQNTAVKALSACGLCFEVGRLLLSPCRTCPRVCVDCWRGQMVSAGLLQPYFRARGDRPERSFDTGLLHIRRGDLAIRANPARLARHLLCPFCSTFSAPLPCPAAILF
jgi:hypothetical protein